MKKWLLLLLIPVIALSGWGLLQLSKSRTFQLFGDIVHRVETEERVVALTFDDGPSENTAAILDVLERLNVQATFFVTGRELAQNPQAGAMIVQAGHELGNHSYSHSRMVFKSPAFIRAEIEQTNKLIRQAGHRGPICFRPPFGKKLLLLPHYLNSQGITTVMWDVEPESCPEVAASSETIREHVAEAVRPGSIILLHVMYDSREQSVLALEGIVNDLRARGYRFVTISQLLKLE